MGSKKEHATRTINFIQLWDKIATAFLKKNDSNYGEIRTSNMYVDLLGIYSGEDNVTYLYSIDGYPKEIENSYRTTLRLQCKPGVRVSFISHLDKTVIDWNSAQNKARFRTWRALDDTTKDVDVYNLYQNLISMDNQDWRRQSIVYLSSAELRRKRKMFKFRSVMLISGKRGEDFNDSVKSIVACCKSNGIKISRVIGDIPEYLKVFSPFSNTVDTKVLDKCGCITIPDELLARFNTYEQGMIGRGGIYWGTDVYSSFPCLKVVKPTPESAENWLITAETGGGKSYMVKGLIVQLLARPIFIGTIMDVEGFEHTPLGEFLARNNLVTFLNMAEGTGAYADPVEIIMTGDPKLDKDMYSLSTSFTLSLFKCLLGTTQEQDEWVDIVITDAVALTYEKAGVDPTDMSTWSRSYGYSLFDVYSTLKGLKANGNVERALAANQSRSLYEEKMGIGKAQTQNDVNRLISSNDGYQKSIDMCMAKLSRYFEPGGVRSHVFRNRITVDQIRDSKLVICSFGMAGKAENTVDSIQMSLMQLYAAYISHLRSIFGKYSGKYNFKVWEEFQRWGGFPDADKTINVALTGGRKLGDVNIVLTNKVRDMLDDDKFGIFSNITSIAIGCIWDADVRQRLCQRLSIEEMLPDLDMLVTQNKDLSAYVDGDTLRSNPFTKAFLIGLDKTAYTISRMTLPQELSESDIFRTGIDLQGGTN